MDLEAIRDEVRIIIPDTDLTDADINVYINLAVQMAGGLVALPELKAIDVVQTSITESFVSLSGITGGFSGRLLRAKSSIKESLMIYPKLELMLDSYSLTDFTGAGDVESVCLEGNNLWYVPIPAVAETLTLLFYQNPPALSGDDSVPSAFPEFLHRQLFVAGTAYLIWEAIEDGVDGDKLNTNTWKGNFNQGINLLRSFVARGRVNYISSTWSA